ERGVLNHAVVQCAHPGFLEIAARSLLLPDGAHDVVSLLFFVTGNQREQFNRSLAVIKRLDERLLNARRAVVSATVAPRFEVMRGVDVPVAGESGLVIVKTQMNARRDLREFLAELEVGRRRVSRIAAENDERIHLTAVNRLRQILERGDAG